MIMRSPNLCFWNLQLANKPEDRDQVVILFQDMLEVVTRDIMMEDHISKCDIFVIGLFKHICI
jgi:callose synthase